MTTADPTTERAEIRSLLVKQIQTLADRVDGQWDEDLERDAEKLQLERLRTLGQLAREYRLLAKDDEGEEEGKSLSEVLSAARENQ